MVDEIKHDETFEALLLNSEGNFKHDKQYLVVDFFAQWCGPCKRYAPRFAELAEEYGKHMKFCKIDVDDHDALAVKYGITSLPTFMIFKVKTAEEEESVILSVQGIGGANTLKLEGGIKDLYDNVENTVVVTKEEEVCDTVECNEVCTPNDNCCGGGGDNPSNNSCC